MKLLVILFLMHSPIFAFENSPKHQVRNFIIKALWSIDALEFAISNGHLATICQSVGQINLILDDLRQRTDEDSLPGGQLIKDKKLIGLINTLPFGSAACASKNELSSEDIEKLSDFKTSTRKKLNHIIPFFK